MLPFFSAPSGVCLRRCGSHARRHPHRDRRVVVIRDSRHGSSRQDPGPLVQRPAASDIPHTTDSGFNTTRLGHRLPTGTALSHAHGTTFIIFAAMHRAASPTIPTKINTTALDLRMATRMAARHAGRDDPDSLTISQHVHVLRPRRRRSKAVLKRTRPY